MNDLTRKLRILVSLNEPRHGGPYQGTAAEQCVEAMAAAADQIDRLEAQLDRVRAELAATVANIAAWDDVLADVIPALHDQMGND